MGVLFYDLGKSVTDKEERETLAESFFDGEMPDTDCLKLTRNFIQEYLEQNFGSTGSRAVDHLLSDIWMVFDTLKKNGLTALSGELRCVLYGPRRHNDV